MFVNPLELQGWRRGETTPRKTGVTNKPKKKTKTKKRKKSLPQLLMFTESIYHESGTVLCTSFSHLGPTGALGILN